MDKGTRTGLFFGASSGVITTIGLMVGLNAGTKSVVAVLGGVFVIAVADSMSDSIGMHLAQESDPDSTRSNIWMATASTFIAKFLTTITFALPVILLPLQTAIFASIIWGLLIITVLSYFLAQYQKIAAFPVIAEHISITAAVIIASHYVGIWANYIFT